MAHHSGFTVGAEVEVASADRSLRGTLFPARISRPCGGNKFVVEYYCREANNRPLSEEVDMALLRPLRPPEPDTSFDFGDEVEAFFNGGWWEGVITDVAEGPMYWVYFRLANQEVKFQPSELRRHREWKNGTWLPSREVSLKTKANSSGTRIKELSKGAVVEVQSDEDGFQGSWFAAKVVSAVGNNKYLIEYQTLRTEDGAGFLREEFDIQHIRPCPPKAVRVGGFNLNEKVDGFCNDGWWEGVICKVLKGSRYMVYFQGTEDEDKFLQSDLRPHQDWVDGTWIMASQEVSPKTEANSSKARMKKLRKGTTIEIHPDEDGFQGSWFAAKVVNAVGQNKCLIEYESLRTKDDTSFLREEVDLRHIRPRPPQAVKIDAFNLNEEVDAFYNDGWWEGVISKVLKASRYKVYFPGTQDEAEFPHSDLRPRQRWVDGTWIMASQAKKF